MPHQDSISKLIAFYSTLISLEKGEIAALIPQLKEQLFPVKSTLLNAGEISTGVFFITSGFVRAHTLNEDREQTRHFAGVNEFAGNVSSMLLNTPSHYTLQALETTQTVFVGKEVFSWVLENLKEGEKLLRLLYSYTYATEVSKVQSLLASSPMDRYREIVARFPDIEQRVPQKMIASFLRVTPVYLSMLKSKIRSESKSETKP